MIDRATLDRRTILAGGAAAAGMLMAGRTAAAAAGGLDAVAARKNLSFGTCLAWSRPGADSGSLSNPRYAALVARDCGIAVPENALKWQATRPAPDRFDFTRFDAILARAERAGLRMRGHTLLWHYDKWFPKWLVDHDFGSDGRREAERILSAHIRTVCGRYGRRIASYDVVNEAVDPADASLRSTALSRAMGSPEAVLDLAFHTARAAAPHAELVYNDYMGWEAATRSTARACCACWRASGSAARRSTRWACSRTSASSRPWIPSSGSRGSSHPHGGASSIRWPGWAIGWS